MDKVECWKCGGTGVVGWALHVANGVCFDCNGKGKLVAGKAPAFRDLCAIFVNHHLHHQILTIAECMTRKGRVTVTATDFGRAFAVEALVAGKARTQLVGGKAFTDLDAALKAAKAHATAEGLTFVPYVYGDTRPMPAARKAAMRDYAARWARHHGARFGLPVEFIGRRDEFSNDDAGDSAAARAIFPDWKAWAAANLAVKG